MSSLLILAPEPDGPSTRHRWRALEGHLRAAGLEPEVVGLPADSGSRGAAWDRAAAADLVVLQRRLLRATDFRRLRRASRRLVYDYDDAMAFRDPFRGPAQSTVRAERFLQACVESDAVVAGNEALADLARPAEPRAVFVAPTPVDTARYGPSPVQRDDGAFRVGWIGSRATLGYLDDLAAPLAAASRRIPSLRLVVVADAAPTPEGVAVEAIPWTPDGEAAALRSLDVGLMPLRNDPFSAGKCGFKLLQYAASGLPLLASPVGVNTQIVEEGRSGYLCPTDDAWEEALVRLAADRGLGRRLGLAARRDAERRWSTDVLGPPLAAFLARVAASPERRR